MSYTIFNEYLNILRKCHSIELENELFFEFVKKNPEYNHFYNFTLQEFDHKSFLEYLIENDILNPNGITEFKGKMCKNTHLYLESLIAMKNAYYHIVFDLPLFLRNSKKEEFFDDNLKYILAEPYIDSVQFNERYITIQALLIDAIGIVYPDELKNLLEDYKFNMVLSSSELIDYGTVDYNETNRNNQLKNYHSFMKYMSKFLIEI
jgi:hypothetical protein